MDWKEGEKQGGKTEPFRAYLATNLHVLASLKNPKDYSPYNQPDPALGWTISFRLGKYTDVKQFVLPSKLGLPNFEQAFVFTQLAVIPKTAFLARDFFDYTLPKDAKAWKQGNQSDKTVTHPYADFAVLELPLFLDNPTDRNIFDHLIQPAIRTYKQLGDSLNIFVDNPINQLKNHSYYLLGYPNLQSKVKTLLINQTGKKQIKPEQILQQTNQNRFLLYSGRGTPNLISTKGATFNQSEFAWNYEHSKSFKFKHQYTYKQYQAYGKGLAVVHADFSGGVSGALVLNDQKQIVGIYFATTRSSKQAWGLA
ncbi:DUF31 family protein [Mycoplasmoides pneumoniae]|uniref:DUF31 family protein n=1 Tax=Mycoplasmoides pneumoniae TaxID=2104 RepID=UPI001E39D357|nr:DUF31 family protein [Mycoplasmoides pneumoniae]